MPLYHLREQRRLVSPALSISLILTLALIQNSNQELFGLNIALAAENATPAATLGATDCRVSPRPAEDFLALPEEPRIAATPAMAPTELPGGTVADQQTSAAVIETIEELFACTNAGDPLRMAALYTDDAFMRTFSGPGPNTSHDVLETLLAPSALSPDLQVTVESIEDVQILPDGRVTAIVEADGRKSLAILVEDDGRFLIDSTSELQGTATPTP